MGFNWSHLICRNAMRKLLTILILLPLVSFSQRMNGWMLPPHVNYMNLPTATAGVVYSSNAEVIAAFGSTTIRGKKFRANTAGSNTNLIWIGGTCSGVIIEDCFFEYALGGTDGNRAIVITANNTTVRRCLLSNAGQGIYVSGTTGGVSIYNNQCMNMRGPFPMGQFIQTNGISGAGNYIGHNRIENWAIESFPEDAINLFNSSGTSGSPFIVEYNYIRGGGPSTSGGGIVCGDNGGSYTTTRNNKLVNCGQYGLGIAGGTNNTITGNQIYCVRTPFNNVGLTVIAWTTPCSSTSVTNNYVSYTNSSNSRNDNYYATDLPCTGTKDAPSDITLAQMYFPPTIITFIPPNQVWQLRHASKAQESDITSAATGQGYTTAQSTRPTANAGTDQSISVSSATLTSSSTASSGNSISSYRWVQESGPGNVSFSAPTSSSTTVSGLVVGVYVFRLEVKQTIMTNFISADSDTVTITVTSP